MNDYEKATLIATEISDDEPFAQSDAVQCLASEFLILKQKFEKTEEALGLISGASRMGTLPSTIVVPADVWDKAINLLPVLDT